MLSKISLARIKNETKVKRISESLVDFELRLKYLIRRVLYLGYRIRVAVD